MPNPKVTDVIRAMLAVHSDAITPDVVVAWLEPLIERLNESDMTDERFIKGSQLPTTVGGMADEYSVVRAERLRIEKEAKGVKDRETELFNVTMSTLNESTDSGAAGDFYRVQRVEKDQANVEDWPTFWAHVQATGNFDLMQKRLNDKAIKDRFEAGDVVPGVKVEKVPTLSFRKVD